MEPLVTLRGGERGRGKALEPRSLSVGPGVSASRSLTVE